MTIPNASEQFQAMHAVVPVEQNPGYLLYWADRAANDPKDERLNKIVSGLTHVAIRGEEGVAEFTDREPALQARYWYRALGPLNPMTDVEHDLVTASSLMYDQRTANTGETANLRLDSAYALTELARITKNPETRRDGLLLALDSVKGIIDDPRFTEKDASYKLQTYILEQDLRHDALRLRYTGSFEPGPIKDIETFRAFEKDFVKEELRGLENFAKLLGSGITDENFGVLFESFYIMLRRHKSWQDEDIDTISVRGATSRENAEWTGEFDIDPKRITGNHDIVVSAFQEAAMPRRSRIQLKTVKGNTTYHPRVTVLDFEEVIKQKFGSIDVATKALSKKLGAVRRDYVEALS